MTTIAPVGTFFLPGPTEVRHETLVAMLQPMIPHRGAAFESLFARIQTGLKRVFRTGEQVLVSTSSATGLMEASVRCAPPGPVLSLVNGAFAERFANVAAACGRETDVIEVEWGTTVPLDLVEARLGARRYAAVTVVHSETSTGALADVRAVTELARRYGAFCLVDSVTGVAGAPLEFDAWELDFVFTGSQKALAIPPGLAFAVASPAYMARAAEAPARGVYFDLVEFARNGAKNQTPNTPALSLLYALDRQLEHVDAAGGIEARWAAHAAMAETTWRWATRLDGVDVLAAPGERSPTVSALTLPPGISPSGVVKDVAKLGYVIGNGYGRLRESTVRIGHMGDHTVDTLVGCLSAVEEVLRSQGVGGGV
ncbi:MAG TPA: aminotransferase class V-fold PLP-dependent enzyme [Gemmatimonadaceae bacterium]|nr:aminotransferase class V-fold PLP-dependent enzyme [Gemmatimonadaceae bacterium]